MLARVAEASPLRVPGLERAARYERTVAASLERVWENVLDWEHLPWLHRTSFSGIECREAGTWGWRARVELTPPGGSIELELAIELEARRYVARTLAGPGAGTEIWTWLTPESDARTGIRVEFHLPVPPGTGAAALGREYVRLYARLWDEDEAMMQRRSAELRALPARRGAGPSRLALGREDALRARLPLVVELAGRRFRVLELAGRLVAHDVRCPHRLGPLERAPVEDGCLVCPWHGHRFDLASGASQQGDGLRLFPAPEVRIDPETGDVVLALRA
jgi:nitrite reductase/ring-hydroxylating ferredoxin subunit